MLRLALILAVFLAACGSPQAEDSARQQRPVPSADSEKTMEHSEFLAAAKSSTNRLQLDLKRELSAAMGESGPVGAIQVCSQRATVLTAEVSERTGLDVRRVSLRHRNPENRATPGEASVLAMMAARPDLADTMIVRDGAPLYMRAIRINTPLCLQCHGSRDDLAPEVVQQLDALYEEDQATGF
jgi:hypothetical protein